jgi:hypothetical protein
VEIQREVRGLKASWKAEMSVLLNITNTGGGGEPSSSTPLATEAVFEKLWMNGATAIDAKWIPLFQSGIDVETEDLPSLCEELRTLRRWAESSRMDDGDQSLMLARIDAALRRLDAASGMNTKSVRIFIG